MPGMNIIQVISPALTVVAIAIPIFLGFFILDREVYVSSQYIVNTAVRTMDRDQPYLFPVPSPDIDVYDRSYACMMDAGIGRNASQCSTQESIADFRRCVRVTSVAQCDSFITQNSEIGFLKCLQRNYDVTIRQTSVFLECLSLSQPVTFQSFQNTASTAFMGSYNYAVLLVCALTVMASFVVMTSGGWFFPDSVSLYQQKENHISGYKKKYWSPFAIYRIYISWAWNLIALLIAVIIAYSNSDVNFANKEDPVKRFPVTLWTCISSIAVFGLAVAFYTSYAFEWVFAGTTALFAVSNGGSNDDQSESAGPVMPPVQPTRPQVFEGPGLGNNWYASGRPGIITQMQPYSLTSRFNPLGKWGRGTVGRYIGVKLYDNDVSTDEEITAKHIMPLMIQAFAWTWVLSDGLFFVGMITSQSSPTQESVNKVFFTIIAGRLFQLALAYFYYAAFIRVIGEDSQKINVIIACVLTHMAGLLCIGLGTAEFMSTLGFSYASSQPFKDFPSYHSLQWVFIAFVVIGPEVWRSANLAFSVFRTFNDNQILISMELLFMWEWISRGIIAIIAIVPLAAALKDQQDAFIGYIAGP